MSSLDAGKELMQSDKHSAECSWENDTGFDARTPFGAIDMFDDGGHRAVELMLLSAAACLDYFLVEYARTRKLDVSNIHVHCEGEMANQPIRVNKIITMVTITGNISDQEANKMVTMCERACKVMNTLKSTPECRLSVNSVQPGLVK